MGIFIDKYPKSKPLSNKSREDDLGLDNLAVFEWCMCLKENDAETNYNLFNSLFELIDNSDISDDDKFRELRALDYTRGVILRYADVIKCPYEDEKDRMIFVLKDMTNDLLSVKDEEGYLSNLKYVSNLLMAQYAARYRSFTMDFATIQQMAIEFEISPIMFIGLANNMIVNI